MKHTIEVNGIKIYAFHGCLPEEEKINFEYDTSRLSWYENEGEIKDPNTAMAKMFEPGTNSKREERDL